jgi:hypothetical protein
MNKREAIIKDVESDKCMVLDNGTEIEDVLCDGDGCRHPECICWDDFRSAVERALDDQYIAVNFGSIERMKSLYDAEVKYGIHIPEGTKPELMPDLDGVY